MALLHWTNARIAEDRKLNRRRCKSVVLRLGLLFVSSLSAMSVIGLYCLPLSIDTFFHYISGKETALLLFILFQAFVSSDPALCIGTRGQDEREEALYLLKSLLVIYNHLLLTFKRILTKLGEDGSRSLSVLKIICISLMVLLSLLKHHRLHL